MTAEEYPAAERAAEFRSEEPPMASRVLENRTFHPHDSTKTANSFLPQAESISESMPQGVTEFRCSFRCS